MLKALSKLKKLRGRGFDELKVRGAQALSAYAEMAGLSGAAREPSDAKFFRLLAPPRRAGGPSAEGLLEHFRGRTAPRFFAGFEDGGGTREELRRRFAPGRGPLVESAERLTRGRFDLLGLRDLSFGDPVDWHLEPVAGKRAPLVHWSRVDYLDPDVAGDKKIVWELNRHQHFMTLGRAYRVTGDERYARTFDDHLGAWMEANPPKLGINWASSLEVAFRAISWLWALHFFRDSTQLRPATFLRALKFLRLHARHLETYLSVYFSPNTHLTGEALGLFYLGTLLPEFPDAARWAATGRRILLEQLPRHVRGDGVYFEQSSYYQRYTADFYTHFLLLAEANSAGVGGEVRPKLAALLDHLMHITRPDGTSPFYGDDDGGRLSPLDGRAADDFRATLSNGAAIFARPEYKYVAGAASEETLWLTGRAGLRAFDRLEARPPAHNSRAFPEGGYYSARDGWAADADYLLVDCGPHGAPNGAHAHADALSFELAARGRTLLVDPGTYTYTGEPEMRDHFRSTAAHNTLCVDGVSSSVPAGPFSWGAEARARTRRWAGGERFAYFEGAHDGYERLASPVTHERSVLFLGGAYTVVRDRAVTEGEHRYELNFHFAPDAEPVLETNPARRVRAAGQPGLTLYTFGAGGAWRREWDWVSSCYGARRRAPLCVYSAAGRGEQEFYSFLIPHPDARGRLSCEREPAGEGVRAFRVDGGDARDLLLVRPPAAGGGPGAAAAACGCSTDFEWTWVRLGEDGTPAAWTLVGGSRFAYGGRELFGAAAGAGYVTARRVGDELVVETDARGDLSVAPGWAGRITVNGRLFRAGGAAGGEGLSPSREKAYVRD